MKKWSQWNSWLYRLVQLRLRIFLILPVLLLITRPLSASPENDDWYALAEQALIEQDHAAVVKITDKIIEGSETDRYVDARFLRGLSHHTLGNTPAAIEDLSIYLQSNGSYAPEASNLLDAIIKAAEANPQPPESTDDAAASQLADSGSGYKFQYSVSIGAQYDDRVLIRPGGPNGDIPADEPEIEDGALTLRSFGQYHNPDGGFFGRYVGDFTGYIDAETERRFLGTGIGGWHTTFGGTPFDLEIAGFGEAILLDWESFRNRFGGHVSLSHSPGSRRDWILLEIGSDDYPDYPDFDGTYYTALGGQQFFQLPWTFGWFAKHLQQGAEADFLEYDETSLGLDASYQVNDDLTLGGAIIYADNPYDSFDPLFDTTREDTYWSGRLFLKYNLSKKWSLQPSVTIIDRSSNVSSLEYDRLLFEVNAVYLDW